MTGHGNVHEYNTADGTQDIGLAIEMPERKDPKQEVLATEEPVSPIDNGNDMERQKTASDYGLVSSMDPLGHGGDIEYKTMAWWHVGLLMIAETVSLGVLSLPSAVATMGLLPGLFVISSCGLLATYSGYVIWQFRMKHPHVLSFSDAGQIMLGAFGRELFTLASQAQLVCYMASHILTFSIMMNVLTDHGTCTIAFGCLGFVLSLLLTLPRKMQKLAYISIASFLSVLSALIVTMISLGLTKKGGEDVVLVVYGTKIDVIFIAVMDIIIAYSGNVAFFGFIAELKHPETFPKALFMLQGTAITIYLTAAVVVYYYVGGNIVSPALGSTGPIVRKIAYGIAMPTILVAGVINGHVAIKYFYIRLWRKRNPNVISQRTFKARASWVAICAALWAVAWFLAEAIPSFNNLLALIGALFGSWFTFGLSGFMWMSLNKGSYTESKRKMLLTAVNLAMIALAVVLCGLGLYASGKAIHEQKGGSSFSCENNYHPHRIGG